MAKKGKKTPSEAPLELDLNHPAIVAAQTVVDRWVRRVDESRGGLLESQKALRSITAQIEVVQQEVEEIRVEASLLWSLRLEDLRAKRDQNNSAARATSGAARKPARKSRSVSEEKVEKILSPAPSNTSELSFDGAAKNIEEKKRAKISIALQNLFRIPKGVSVQTCSTLSVPSLSHSAGASKLTTMQSITTPTAHDDDADSQRASFKRKLSNSASLMNPMAVLSPATDYNNALPSPDHKKPRDVPAVLWDEMVLLRERRIHTDDRYDSLNRDLAGQMNRFELLQENSMISYYALESAAAALKKITMDCFHELERGRASTVLDRIGSPTDPPLTSEM